MLIKQHELKSFRIGTVNYYLLYGQNSGLIQETVDQIFKPNLSRNIINYDETDVVNNIDLFKEKIFNKSFFENEKLIIIRRATDKLVNLIKEILEKNPEDIKILIMSGILEKKSKLRNLFEKEKRAIAITFYEDNYQSLLAMIQKTLREKKINVSNESINLIIERSNGSRTNITNELEKIASYASNNNKVSLKDILKLTNLGENYKISELVDQNLLKNKKKTINILNENNLNSEENILTLRTYLNKLKRLKKLKIDLKKNKNIDQVIASSKPPIFWKDKIVVKQQLNALSIAEINHLIKKINSLELTIKKNNQISDQILNNFILENLLTTNNIT